VGGHVRVDLREVGLVDQLDDEHDGSLRQVLRRRKGVWETVAVGEKQRAD
jgi:hypothetical protein